MSDIPISGSFIGIPGSGFIPQGTGGPIFCPSGHIQEAFYPMQGTIEYACKVCGNRVEMILESDIGSVCKSCYDKYLEWQRASSTPPRPSGPRKVIVDD